MIRKILLSVSIVSMVIVGGSFASVNNTMTTKGYVDTEIEKKQLTIPAAGTAGAGLGETVVTYTGTAGEIGERELFTGGTYDATNDADKLITASALKSAFTLPETQTTKLTCANPGTCDLWTITNQTAYGRAAAPTIDLSALVNTNGTAHCGASLSGSGKAAQFDEGCTTARTGYGEWGVVFPYNGSTIQVNGISACSSLAGTYAQPASNQAAVQSDYEADMNAAPTSEPAGGNCYCKMTDPTTSAARWVFYRSNDALGCTDLCANDCAGILRNWSDLRGAVFGVQQ